MNVEGSSHGLNFNALQLAQSHSGTFEFQAIALDSFGPGSRHRHLLSLVGSVYFIEGGSAVSSIRLFGVARSGSSASRNTASRGSNQPPDTGI